MIAYVNLFNKPLIVKKVTMKKNYLHSRLTASIVMICFVAAFIISAVTGMIHANHVDDYEVMCRSTSMPVCNCDSENSTAVYEFYHHIETVDDCRICALVYKSINQLKINFLSVCSAVHTDIFIDQNTIQGLEIINNISLTPVDLNVKHSN